MSDEVELLKRVYDRFNARDMETVLAAMHEDVLWANGMEGGHVRGRNEVRSYWTRQWAMIDPHVEPVAFASGLDGEVIVEVHQVVRDLNGNLLADKMVGHVFRIENGLVKRFDPRRVMPSSAAFRVVSLGARIFRHAPSASEQEYFPTDSRQAFLDALQNSAWQGQENTRKLSHGNQCA
jgi:hypothetical protein